LKETAKKPWIHWYPSDHDSDPGVKELDALSEHVWRKMTDMMSQCKPYGRLEIEGKPVSLETLARYCKLALADLKKCLVLIREKGVCGFDAAKSIYFSRRMIRDEKYRTNARKFGKSGGNPALRQSAEAPAPKSAASRGLQPSSRFIEWNGVEYYPSQLNKILLEKEAQARFFEKQGIKDNIHRQHPYSILKREITDIATKLKGFQPELPARAVQKRVSQSQEEKYQAEIAAIKADPARLAQKLADLKASEDSILAKDGEMSHAYWKNGRQTNFAKKAIKLIRVERKKLEGK
jgi:hypothetical protein